MILLVLNAGSTSLKYDVYALAPGEPRLATGDRPHDGIAALATALAEVVAIVDALAREHGAVIAVGHRVVHGGGRAEAAIVDAAIEAEIAANAAFAPLHNPLALAAIHAARAHFPAIPHVAVFDTAFHATLPPRAFTYAIPQDLARAHGLRRYGFHGPSHRYMLEAAAHALGRPPASLRLVTCHLGGGASACAIADGRSIDTSMGLTPLEGLVMGTRAGDLDPAIPVALARAGLDPDALDDLLNHRGGLYALAGTADMRAILAAADAGDARAILARDVFAYRLRKYVGAYLAVLGGADAIVFTGGIGEHAPAIRAAACDGLAGLGVELDATRNAAVDRVARGGVEDVAAAASRIRVLVVHTEEERVIARDVAARLAFSLAGGAIDRSS